MKTALAIKGKNFEKPKGKAKAKEGKKKIRDPGESEDIGAVSVLEEVDGDKD